MRQVFTVSGLVLAMATLTACSPDSDSGPTYLNPARSVNLSLPYGTFDDFTLEDEEGLESVLDNTAFYDFYRGLEPAEGQEDNGAADAIRARLELLMGLTPNTDGSAYIKARNPIDFLNAMIDSNLVNTFNDGRNLMVRSVSNGDASVYSSSQAGASIRFEEPTDVNSNLENVWNFPILGWRAAPAGGTVVKAFQFASKANTEAEKAANPIRVANYSVAFDSEQFSAIGRNQPIVASISLNTRTLGEVDYFQDFTINQYDTVFFRNTSDLVLNGESVVYACVEIDYAKDTEGNGQYVNIFYLTQEDIENPDDVPDSGNSPVGFRCPEVGTQITYESVAVPGRQ